VTERAKPPENISPDEFFTRWVPEMVAADEQRQAKLRNTNAVIVFELGGEDGHPYTLRIEEGRVGGSPGAVPEPDLRVRVDLATWRDLNAGRITAPEALLRRRVKLEGDFLLGLKLHLIIG
jgi:putative sterol carrier protein